MRRPNVITRHGAIVAAAHARVLFPADVEPFVKVATIGWVGVLSQECRVSLEVRTLVYVKRVFSVLRQCEESLPRNQRAFDDTLGYAMVLD